MLSRHVLTPEDLGSLIAAVFSYNGRGQVQGVAFYDHTGKPVSIGYAEAICEEPGLRVRQEPEESPEDRLKRIAIGAEPVTDPRSVPGPSSIHELAAATGET